MSTDVGLTLRAEAEQLPVPCPTPFTAMVMVLEPSLTTTEPLLNEADGLARWILTSLVPTTLAVMAELCDAAE